LVGLGPVTECFVVTRRRIDELSDEVGVRVEHFLGSDRVDFGLGPRGVLLDLEEVVGLEQNQVDFFQNLEVDVDETFFARFAVLECYKVAGCHCVLQVLE